MSRILIAGDVLVSDEPSLILKASGYQILSFTSSHDAIGHVLEDPPDILILDKDIDGCLDLLNAAKACLQKTNMPILMAVEPKELSTLDWDEFSVDDILVKPVDSENLFARIRLAQSRMVRVFDNNPLSRLPGNTSILQAIQKTIELDESHGVCYVDIDNFKPYNDRYGFSQGDDVILMVARIIVNVMEEVARNKSFVGHVGGDDFLFIIPEDIVDDPRDRFTGLMVPVDKLVHRTKRLLSSASLPVNAPPGDDDEQRGLPPYGHHLSKSYIHCVAQPVPGELIHQRHLGVCHQVADRSAYPLPYLSTVVLVILERSH